MARPKAGVPRQMYPFCATVLSPGGPTAQPATILCIKQCTMNKHQHCPPCPASAQQSADQATHHLHGSPWQERIAKGLQSYASSADHKDWVSGSASLLTNKIRLQMFWARKPAHPPYRGQSDHCRQSWCSTAQTDLRHFGIAGSTILGLSWSLLQ